MLNFPMSKMDLTFWKNIIDNGARTELINANTKLAQFNRVYDGVSLFHYFAENVDVIEMIHDKFKLAEENGLLTDADINMPLVILHPDQNGKTALETAILNERPKSFELMINLLEPFGNYCLSKMMLSVFPHMIKQGSNMIVKFFGSGVYQPILMQDALLVPWPEDKD
jgi:hypothetical protein